jgi:hypothetical protein
MTLLAKVNHFLEARFSPKIISYAIELLILFIFTKISSRSYACYSKGSN